MLFFVMADIYFNKIQQRVMFIGAKTSVIVAGRRTGKTYGMGAPFALRNMQRMEGSTGGIVVPTFRHGLTNTLPGLFSCWQAMGLIEGVHYVVGKKPPKYFKKAKVEPREFKRKIPALIEDFCTYYRNYRKKMVIFYFDSTALNSNYAVNKDDFRKVIEREFKSHGWKIKSVYLGHPMRHNEKYLLINSGFAGKQRLTPYFNIDNNEALLIAIQSAGVLTGNVGCGGFPLDVRVGGKDNLLHRLFREAGEKLAESEENLLEHRTDGTDAFDTLYIGMNNKPVKTTAFNIFGTA